MEPPGPPSRGIGAAHSQGGGRRTPSLSSAATPTSTLASTMANAPLTARAAAPPTVYADPKSADEPASASASTPVDAAARSSAADAMARQLVQQLSDSMLATLRQVATQYGVGDAVSEPVGDARSVVQELTRARRRAAELQLLVDDLQTEQRVARERLALYSILALKLKRELVNEKLAHIDTRKEVDEIRQQYESGGGGGGSSVGARSPEARSVRQHHPPSTQRRGSYESLRGALSADEDDPWSSPNKPTASDAAFSRFYAPSRQPQPSGRSTQAHDDREDTARGGDGGMQDDDDDDDDERMMGMQPLRNSLIGQFLPSALLDSPQLTPKTRSVADNQEQDAQELPEETEETKPTGETKLTSSALQQKDAAACDACGLSRAPVVELVDCGHRLCRVCEVASSSSSADEPPSSTHHQCPRCLQPVVTPVRRLDVTGGTRTGGTTGDNQMDHLRIETARPLSSDSTATAFSVSTTTPTMTTVSGGSIAPLTLSLLSEMFENISLDDLELYLKDASGQISGAIERILQRHPSFNPALAAEVSVTAGPGAGSSGQKGGPGSLHRLGSSGIPSHQQQSQQQQGGGSSGSASGNWKTEMCMYYLQGKCNKTRRTCSFAHGESDLVRTNTPKHTSSTSFKSRMCPLWLDGSCPKSRRECPLAHGENDLRDGLALLSQSAGGGAAGGGGGATGGSTIPAPTLPTTAPRLQNYKTELCYYYLKGCCNFTKEECRFAHGESDLRTVESNTLEWSAQLGAAAAAGDKPSTHQHQYQQQYQHHQQQSFVPQYQPQPPQPPPQQPALLHQHQQYGLTSLPAPFVPQSHQYHPMAPPPQAHAVPPPQGPYSAASQHQPPFRYMKSMDDAKPPRRPAPPRRESTWSQPNYDSSMGPDF